MSAMDAIHRHDRRQDRKYKKEWKSKNESVIYNPELI